MTFGWLLVFRKVSAEGGFFRKAVVPASEAGYGMYLSHMVVLSLVATPLVARLGRGADGLLGPVWTTPVEILGIAVLSFLGTALACILLRRIPKLGKWIIG